MFAPEECLTTPGGEALRPSIEHMRVSIHCAYRRPLDECVEVLDRYLAIQLALPPRAIAVTVACSAWPELVPRYLDPVIAEL